MRLKSYAATAGAAAVALGIWLAPGTIIGQPLYDRIKVDLPYKIVLGDKTLEPGDYTIQQLPGNGGASRVLLFYTNNGMKFETSALTIPALDPNTARDTKLVLGHVGDDYYINKIWVQGKDYGYELPIPKSLKDRQNERMTETTVAAQYQPSADTTATTNAQNTNQAPTNTDTATSTRTTPQTTPPPVTSQTDTSLSANNNTTPSPQAPPQATPAPAPTPAPDNSADRAMADQTPTSSAPAMPHTAANWLMMLLGGGTLSGAGMLLNRKRR